MKRPAFLGHCLEKPPLVLSTERYQSDEAVAQYCDAHYGPDKFGVPNFAARLARLCLEKRNESGRRRALELGCAMGRACFELAKHFDEVVGIDFSPRFVKIARRLQERGKLTYQIFEEGDLVADCQVDLSDLDLAATAHRVAFHQGNAMKIDENLGQFDLVLAASLIDRLPNPEAFLGEAHNLLVDDGLLALASPYNWLEEFTPRKYWLGGSFHAGKPRTSLEGLRKKLCRHFKPLGAPRDLELVIRENARKYQHYVSQVTFWQRRPLRRGQLF